MQIDCYNNFENQLKVDISFSLHEAGEEVGCTVVLQHKGLSIV